MSNPKGTQLKIKVFLTSEQHSQNMNCWVHLELSRVLKRLPSETTFITGQCYLGTLFLTGAILQVCKTISVIQYHRQNTTVQNTYCKVMQQPNHNQPPGSWCPPPPMSRWAEDLGELNTGV